VRALARRHGACRKPACEREAADEARRPHSDLIFRGSTRSLLIGDPDDSVPATVRKLSIP